MADHHDSPQETAAKFVAKVKESPFIMLSTMDGQHSEPMNVKLDDDQPNALFVFAGKDNRAAKGGPGRVQFVSKGQDFFASLIGAISQDRDQQQIDKLWDNRVAAWFPNGQADAVLLRFDVESAELWETDVSLSGRLKMLLGATITPSESSTHAMVDSLG